MKQTSVTNRIEAEAAIASLHRRIRLLLILFTIGLAISGITAFPLVTELNLLNRLLGPGTMAATQWPDLSQWVSHVHQGLTEMDAKYPFIFYGTDWLAFAHLVIAVAFWGPIKDAVKNVWVIEFGMIACLMIIPLALICGSIRGIPFYWRLIDCSFCIGGLIPLGLARKYVQQVIELQKKA
ncbi:MAG: hypothetical protein V4714_00485 [Bacteroidota bacterium]